MSTTPVLTPEERDVLKAKALGEKLAAIVSDDEIVKVHSHANFGSMTPREVVNDGIRKTAVGYHCGHTQFTILRKHGLITKPRPGSYDADLTKKGKAYARALYHDESVIAELTTRAEKAEQQTAVYREYYEANDEVRRVGRLNSTEAQDDRLALAAAAVAALSTEVVRHD